MNTNTTNKGRLLVIRVPFLIPRIFDGILCDCPHRVNNPARHVFALCRADGLVGVLCQQPSGVDLRHICLVWLVNPDVNRLHKSGATARNNKLYLNAKTLDCIGNAAEHMDPKGVQKRIGMMPAGAVAT